MDSENIYYSPFDARLKHSFFMTVCGPSQSGKTTFILNLLDNWERLVTENIDYIVWCYGETNDLLSMLPKRYGDRKLSLVKGMPVDFNDYIIPYKKGLLILDDLMSESSDNPALTRLISNKVHHASLSVISAVQNLFSAGKERTTYMQSCQYIVMFKNPLNNTTPRILGQRFMPGKVKTFLEIYKHSVTSPFRYLFIDGTQTTPEHARLRTDIFGDTQRVYFY